MSEPVNSTRSSVRFIVPHATRERLKTTCFRHQACGDAGRITLWNNAQEVIEDRRVRGPLLTEVARAVNAGEVPDDFSLTVELDEVVGWESTIDYEDARGLHVARSDLNRHASALFVDDDTPAPRTNKLTVVFNVTEGRTEDFAVFVVSIYPGVDVGGLDGDVSERERRVFFPWGSRGDDGTRWTGL